MEKMKHSSARRRKRRRMHPIACWTLLLLAFCSSQLLFGFVSSQAAVVRPTIFSDLNQSPSSNSEAAATQQQQQQISQQQQQQQPQQQTAQQAPQATQNNPQISQTSPPSDGPQSPSTKITPFKSRFCTTQAGLRFDAPLGLQSLAIDDLALTASSYSNEQVGPHLARLNLDISGGAWCPVKPISSSNFGKEWIQVKLNRSHVISAIETQGRFGMGNGKEFVPSYQIEYSRDSGIHWHKWKDFRGSSLLRANEDPNSAVKNELSPPIVGANVIRILPYSQHLRTVCLRFELHGCPYDDGAPIAYSTTDGVVEPRWGHLIDYTYDGIRQRGHLSGGLGQLVDGVKGADNFSHNNGFEWVGWKSPASGELVIEFTFRTLRNFTSALFHSNNLFSSGVEVFQAVDVHYGIDLALSMDSIKDSIHEQRRRDALLRRHQQPQLLQQLKQQQDNQLNSPIIEQQTLLQQQQQQQQTLWSPEQLSIEYEPDKVLEASRPVTVHLKQRLANKLRFVLKFSSKWILVSEVEFISQAVELLAGGSLAHQADQQQTVALMQALAPAKSYDEFIAILREHQLRRIATNAYLESFNQSYSPNTESISESSEQTVSSEQPIVGPTPSSVYDMTGARLQHFQPPNQRRPNQPNIWQQQQTIGGADPNAPSTNPVLSVPNFNSLPAAPPPPSILFNSRQSEEAGSDPFWRGRQKNNIPNNNMAGTEEAANASATDRRTIGLATVISFVLVSIILLLGAIFALSSYRLRKHPKLGTPIPVGMGVSSARGAHFASSSAGGSSGRGSGSKGLQSFMSVFSSALGGRGANHSTASQQSNDYNAIFASGDQLMRSTAHNAEAAAAMRAASTLRRLASLTGTQKSAHPLLAQHQQQQQQSNNLLVSLKDNSSSLTNPIFGGTPSHAQANKAQAVSTQLIVGLNQANPMAQQQIYNNSSNFNCNSNQTYATLSSSSTTTGQPADYGDYAIPDAQPIIPAPLPYHHHQMQQPHHHQQQQQLHQHHAFSTTNHNIHQHQQQLGQQQQQHHQGLPFAYGTTRSSFLGQRHFTTNKFNV